MREEKWRLTENHDLLGAGLDWDGDNSHGLGGSKGENGDGESELHDDRE